MAKIIFIARLALQVVLIAIAGYGVGLLFNEMIHERLDLHGFDAVAALIGWLPFMFIIGVSPILIIGFFIQILIWIFNIKDL